MNDKFLIFILSFSVLSASILYSQQEPEYVREFRIGPWDVLGVTVYGEQNYSGVRVTVTEYGRIRVPLLNEDVDVFGLSLGELEGKLSQLFVEKGIFQNPSVTTVVLERRSQRVSIIGAVANPGPYELRGRQKLLSVIADLGGFTIYDGDITLIREQQDPLKIAIKDLVSGEDRYNLPLQPKDIIIVRPEETVVLYVDGAVKSPGILQVPISNIPTLYRVIIRLGGFTERASKGNVKIKRMDENGEERIIPVNVKDIINGEIPDFPLQAGDVIIVGSKLF